MGGAYLERDKRELTGVMDIYLDLSDGHTGVYIYQNLQSVHLIPRHFTICKLYLSEVFLPLKKMLIGYPGKGI